METYYLKMLLLSDTTFGRGDGVAGLLDQEVEHDVNGFPYLRGRTLKGLLSEECDNLIAVLSKQQVSRWQQAAEHLFGISGSTIGTISKMRIGDACLPQDLRTAVALQLEQEKKRGQEIRLTASDILDSLTSIRHQTAINSENGVAREKSLRASRVIVRDLTFTAPLLFEEKPTKDMLALLAVGVLALRRVGSGRNRGRGFVRCTLHNSNSEKIAPSNISDITKENFSYFEQETRD